MSVTSRAVHAAVVVAGLLGISGTSSVAVAQRYQHIEPRVSQPARASAATPARSYTAPPARTYSAQPVRAAQTRSRIGIAVETKPTVDQRSFSTLHRDQRVSLRHRSPAIVYYVPAPSGGYGGGGVLDTDGRPLYAAYEMEVARQSASPVSLPDLSGSPYVVAQDGAMIVDVGDGNRRTVPSCAAISAAATPDGHPRTIFYQGPSDGIILRAGNTGRVRGTPAASASACYAVDEWGRTELRY